MCHLCLRKSSGHVRGFLQEGLLLKVADPSSLRFTEGVEYQEVQAIAMTISPMTTVILDLASRRGAFGCGMSPCCRYCSDKMKAGPCPQAAAPMYAVRSRHHNVTKRHNHTHMVMSVHGCACRYRLLLQGNTNSLVRNQGLTPVPIGTVNMAGLLEQWTLKINSEARSRGIVCEQGLGDHA